MINQALQVSQVASLQRSGVPGQGCLLLLLDAVQPVLETLLLAADVLEQLTQVPQHPAQLAAEV